MSRGGVPEKFRGEAIAAARVHLARDRGIEEIAAEIGVRARTLRRWLSADEQRCVLTPVVVVDDVPAAPIAAVMPRRAAPVLILPSGVRVEGLDVEGLAELLRRLG